MKFWKCGKLLLSDSEGGCGLGGLGGLLPPVGDRGGGGGVAACVGGGGGLAGCGGGGSGGLVDCGESDGCGSKERGASCKKESGWVGTGKRGGKVGNAELVGNVRGSNNSGC